jgi:hypothetical protein
MAKNPIASGICQTIITVGEYRQRICCSQFTFFAADGIAYKQLK